ncbi:MAG: hypothetical protein V3T62_11390 [Alphaproteobacteria bacterium]
MLGAGGVLSGCALPFAGPLALSDILTGVSIFSTAATGKGTTELALDLVTGQDCRLLEGIMRADRDFCEEPGSAATEEDFKGLVAWLEDSEPASPSPGDDDAAHIMVADIGLPDATPTQPVTAAVDSTAAPAVVSAPPRTVALASLTELPAEWIVLASAQFGPEPAGLGAIAPASGTSDLIHAKFDSSPLPFIRATRTPDGDLADRAIERMPVDEPGFAERAFTLPPVPARGIVQASERREVHWNNLWPAVDIVNPPLHQDVLRRAVLNKALAASDAAPDFELAPLPPAPAKPMVLAFLPNLKKPMLQAELSSHPKIARAEFDFLWPTPVTPRPMPEDGPVLALLPPSTSISRIK